jgi:hypothetical protein
MQATSTQPGLLRRAARALWGEPPKRIVPPVVLHDIHPGAPPGVTLAGAKMPTKAQKPTILAYASRRMLRASFHEPEYNLAEIQQAMDTEGYLRQSFDKHEELMLKNGWRIISQNKTALDHVHKRLTEISWGQNDPLELIIERGVEDLVELSNVFYVLTRKEDGTAQRYKGKYGKLKYPVTGIFSPNAADMRPFIKQNRRNVRYIDHWKQVIGGRPMKKFKADNVVHMPFRRKKGHVFGTPFCIPALDDILVLRRMEELVEILVHKNAYPFFQYKVGTDQFPAEEYDNNTSEITDVQAQIANMPFEGGLVTPHRHEIVVIATKGKAVNVEPYMRYFEARVLSDLNLSGIDIGRGETANRATAQTMSRGLADRCTRFHLFFSYMFTFYILDDLVLESGLLPTADNRVYLVFPAIDSEERRAKENHALSMYQGGAITETELRIELSRDPITDEQRKDMHFERLDKPLALIKAVDEDSGLGSKAATANREQPENQSKRLTSKPRVAANDALRVLHDEWRDGYDSMLGDLDGVNNFILSLERRLKPLVDSWLRFGVERYKDEAKPERQLYLGSNIKKRFLDDIFSPRVNQLRVIMNKAMDRMQSSLDRAAALSILQNDAEYFIHQLPIVAESFAYARVAQVDRHKEVYWNLMEDACAKCRERAETPVKIARFTLPDLAHHDSCMDGLVIKKEESE